MWDARDDQSPARPARLHQDRAKYIVDYTLQDYNKSR